MRSRCCGRPLRADDGFKKKASEPIRFDLEVLMNKMKKIVLIALALLMVLGAVSCTKKPGSEDNSSQTIEEETLPNYAPDLPNKSFNGMDFTIAVRWMEGDDDYTWNNNDIVSDGMSGDQISNAVFSRNSFFEEKYDVFIEIHKCGNCGTGLFGSPMSTFIHQNAMTGDIPINAILASPYDTVGFAMSGLITDLETVDYLNLENEWWDQSALSDLRMGDRIFMVAGDATIVDNKAVNIYAVNKSIANHYSIPDIYETVRAKEWTLEKLVEYSGMVYTDLGPDGPDLNDQYGFTFWQDQVYTFVTSSGMNFAELDNDGIPRMLISDNRFVDGWEKIIDTINSDGMFNRTKYAISTGWQEDGSVVFNEGRSLFAGMSVASIMNIMAKGTDLDYGIIPAPLYDEEQDDYITTVAAYGYSMLSIPKTTDGKKLSNTGYLLEAFSATSKYMILPVFYDLVLQYRVAQIKDDAEMLDLIYSKIHYDIGNFMNFNDFTTGILNLFINNDKGITTWYAGVEAAITKEIEQMSSIFE